MADQPLFFGRKFGHGETAAAKDEEGIVTEAVGAAGCVDDVAFDASLGAPEHLAVAGEGKSADEAAATSDPAFARNFEIAEQGKEAGVVACILAQTGVGLEVEAVREAGGKDTGAATESVDLEAGVVGEDEQAWRQQRVSPGLQVSVAAECGSVLRRNGHTGETGERFDGNAGAAGGLREIPELARIGGGDMKGGHRCLDVISTHPAVMSNIG